jgi:hypothetical protein
MTEYVGVLEKIYEDSGNGANGPYVKKSFKVAGAPKSFGGFVNNKTAAMYNSVAEGDMVRITTIMNGQYENLDKIERIAAPKPAPEAPPPPTPKYEPRPAPTDGAVTQAVTRIDDKDFRITYLACRRDAIELVSAFVANGAISLGTKAADKADNFYKAVQRYALALAYDAWHVRSSDAAKLEVEAAPEKSSAKTKLEE